MNRFLLAFACFGVLAFSAFGQSSRARVVATPTPAPPKILNDNSPVYDDRGAPVLRGGNPRPSATPTPVTGDGEDEVLKVETNLVTMPVSVLDRDGRFIAGLQQRDFKIFENGAEQKLEYFQSTEQPFTVVLMIDVSPSTKFQIEQIHQSAMMFVQQLRPDDKVMVVAFDENVQVLTQPTNDRFQIRRAIESADFGDGTSLYEAVDHVLNRELTRIQGRKAIVLFTDGVDTTSRRADYDSTLRDAEETDVLIYPIRYDTENAGNGGWGGNQRRGGRQQRGGYPSGNSGGGILGRILGGIVLGGPITMGGGGMQGDYQLGIKYLENLAQNSGGRKFEADSMYNLESSFSGIAEELRRQYSIGYYPENVGQIGDRKQITIRVQRPNVVVRAKTSYIVGQSDRRLAGR
jgi:Ca-activated chloride channel family protein